MEATKSSCQRCGTEIPAGFLACPRCRLLVHANELKSLSEEASLAETSGDLTKALECWRLVMEMLPPETTQYETVLKKVDSLSRKVEETGSKPKDPFWKGKGFWAGSVLAVTLLFSKLKFLLLGFTKMGTLFTMLLAFGVYWTAWGWKFAGGLVLSIYVHEMGHVAMLRHYGIRASAPMFIPGVGALVRLKQHLVNVREDARVGLAGPWWGLGASAACWAAFQVGGWPIVGAIAKTGAWINLFNLLPIGPLDGGRGFTSLSRPQRVIAALGILAAWYFTREGLLVLLGIGALFQVMSSAAPKERDDSVLLQYLFLLGALSALCLVPIPGFPDTK
jgi:Zn-dependent protease